LYLLGCQNTFEAHYLNYICGDKLFSVEEIFRNTTSRDWATYVFLASLLMLTVSKVLRPIKFQEFIQLLATNKYFFLKGKETRLFSWFQFFIVATQVLSISLFLFLGITLFYEDVFLEVNFLFAKVLFVYSSILIVKIVLEKFIGYVFSIEDEINNYVFQKLSYRNLLSLFLFVANVLLIYSFPSNKIIWIVFAIFVLILHLVFMFYILKSKQNSIVNNLFYFILYLCALEISPIIILYKILI